MRKLNLLFAIFAVVLCFSSAPARADLITISITAQVTNVSDPYNWLEGKFQSGDVLTGYYTYDSSASNTSQAPNQGVYYFYSPPCGIVLQGNGITFQSNPSNVDFSITLLDNSPPDDYIWMGSANNNPLWNGTAVTDIGWMLDDVSGKAINSVLLPATAPVLSQWDNGFGIYGGPTKQPFSLSGTVTSATPEPCSLLLLAAGFVISGHRRIR